MQLIRCTSRCFGTEAARKILKAAKVKQVKPSKDVKKYYESIEKRHIMNLFPDKLLRKKMKTPESFYIADETGATIISKYLLESLPRNLPLVEINPGIGLLTRELLKKNIQDLRLYEMNSHFNPRYEALVQKHPRRVQFVEGDFIRLWRLAFQDRMDNGNRVSEFLIGIPRSEWTEDANCRIFCSVGSVNFFKHLINSLVFQTSLLSYGRCEIICAMPPPLFVHLTCSRDAGYLMYRATTFLFQIMFEHEFLDRIPREYFLPWQNDYDLASVNKLSRVQSIQPEFMYLVKITPRKDLFELCPPEKIQALWYFIKQCCVSRKNRIIPTLEKWIIGSGTRLIANTKERKTVLQLNPLLNTSNLPPFSIPATTMSTNDFLPNINVFHQFGDLTPAQMLTIFTEFTNWPEYRECPFVPSMESSFMKMEVSADENIDGINMSDVEEQEKLEKLENPSKTMNAHHISSLSL